MKPKIKIIETKIDKKTGKKVEKASFKKQPDVVLINRRKIRINEIIKRLGLHITAKEYEETYKIVCKLMKRQLGIKRKISKSLGEYDISRLYQAFKNLDLSHEEISYYIFNLFLEKKFKGKTFE